MVNNLTIAQTIIIGVLLGFLAGFALILWAWAVLNLPSIAGMLSMLLLVGILLLILEQ